MDVSAYPATVGPALLARLHSIVDGCLIADPRRRCGLPRVWDDLLALQRDVTSAHTIGGAAASASTAAPSSPTTPGDAAAQYDVLAVLRALEALRLDGAVFAAVATAVCELETCTVDELLAAGVAPLQVMAVRKALGEPLMGPKPPTLVRGARHRTSGYSCVLRLH